MPKQCGFRSQMLSSELFWGSKLLLFLRCRLQAVQSEGLDCWQAVPADMLDEDTLHHALSLKRDDEVRDNAPLTKQTAKFQRHARLEGTSRNLVQWGSGNLSSTCMTVPSVA